MRDPILNHRRALALLCAEGYRASRNARGRHGTKLVRARDRRPIVLPRHAIGMYLRELPGVPVEFELAEGECAIVVVPPTSPRAREPPSADDEPPGRPG